MESSEPSGYSSSYSDSNVFNSDSELEEMKKPTMPDTEPQKPVIEPEHIEETEEKHKGKEIHPAALIVFIDLLIPLMLILSSISCMSIMGMVFVLLLYIHILICNFVRKSFSATQTCLIVDFVVNFVVFIFAIIDYVKNMDYEWVKLLGLNFDNIISSKPTFTTVTSLVAMICQIISIVLMRKTNVQKFIKLRKQIFSSIGVQFGFDLVWAVCNAFNAASNSSYLYLPILLFFIISNISQSCCGRNVIPSVITWIVMCYSLLFALFEIYMVSYIGETYNPGEVLKYIYIAEDSTKGVNVVFAVLFAYISVQNMSAPGLNTGIKREVPQALKVLSDFVLILAFVCTFVFAMFYPNYLSISWMLIPGIASFVNFKTLRKLLFPMLTMVFTVTFVAQVLTTFYMFDPPEEDGVEYRMAFLRLFGLYRYPRDFTFSACGFYIICLLGQIGKITHVKAALPKGKEVKEEVVEEEDDEYEFDDIHDEEEDMSPQASKKSKKQKKQKNRKNKKPKKPNTFIPKLVEKLKLIGRFIYSLFSYISVAAITIIGITIGFYRNRFAFKIICCIFIIIVTLALYQRPIFEFIKFISILMCLFAAFYKTTINEDCISTLDECLMYGKFDDINDMISTGLIPPADMSLAEFIWPIAVILLLSTFLTADDKALHQKLPPFISGAIFVIVAALHLLYMFLYETSIFSLLFLIVGIAMLISQYIGNKPGLAFACCLSCIVVSFQIVVFLLSHFDNARNLITSVIPKSVVDISHIYGPSVEIALLAGILFLSTIAFNTKPSKEMNYFVSSVLYEARWILDNFYFYLCWIFIFLFSIVNENATFIKFLIMLFFSFGRWSAPLFRKIRIAFLIFNILYLCAQFVFHIFDLDDPTSSYYGILEYIGFYFTSPNKPTMTERNLSVAWQLIVILFGIVNSKGYEHKTPDPRFEALFSTRIYNAFCAMLHHWLPIIIQISLCISTLFNPSFFGWFSFVIMVLVNYKESAMQKGANLITLIFNICFMVQYLLFLGFPEAIFHTNFNAMDEIRKKGYSAETEDFIEQWLRWTGVYDVRIAALTSNCVSSFFFTFYLTFKDTFVDYPLRFNELPDLWKHIITLFTTYVYEIMFSLILIIGSCIKTIDGFLFFVLSSCLFLVSLLTNYPKFKALNIMSIATFVVIGLRLLSRLPVFTEEGIASWIKTAFDLPFQGDSGSENLWIVIYALERLTIHIMKADIYKECSEFHEKKLSYRFIRSRQLALLEQIDQDILNEKHELEISQIKSMTSSNVEQMMDSLRGNDNSIMGRAELMSTTTILIQKENKWYSWFYNIYKACAYKTIRLLAGSLHLNSEAGINVLTLETVNILMKKILRTYEDGHEYIPDPREKEFFLKLPPSFPLHLQSIADVIDYQTVNKKKRDLLLLRYVLLFLRRLSLPLLTLMVLIYLYIKPYFFSMIVVIMFCCLILPLDIKGFPIIYRIFFGLILFVYGLRNLCTIDILKPYIIDASNSVTIAQMSISVIKLFGIDPEETSTVEIFLFLFTVYFIVDQLSWCEVYPPKYYFDKYKKILPGFPDEYCYGIMNNPEESLCMNVEKPPGFIQQFKTSMTRSGLIETSYSTVLMIIDVISFLLLLILWGMWSHGDDTSSPLDGGGASYIFKIDVLFIFMLLIQVCFSLLCYAFSLSSNHIALYFVNVIWFIYTYCISFFYIASKNRSTPGSLQFYFFVRFFWHLVAAHKIFRGRRIVAFKYPNFVKDYQLIFYMNKFIRICPFVFEIQTILIWMSQKTKVYLLDFFVIRDVSMQLENLICQQSNPNTENSNKNQHIFLKGGLLLLLLAVILFVPMFFMASGTPSTSANTPTSIQLEIGISSFPTFLSCEGTITPITSSQHQQIADSGIESLYFLVLSARETISIIDFPVVSFIEWNPSSELTSLMTDMLKSNQEIVPYYRLSVFFDKPTSISSVQNVVHQGRLPALNSTEKTALTDLIRGNYSERLGPLSLPLTLFVPTEENMHETDELRRDVQLELVSTTQTLWQLILADDESTLPTFLRSDNSFRMLLWSQEVNDNFQTAIMSTDPSIIGVYILLIITIGMVLRAFALQIINSLWIDRMDRPQKLYRMVVAMNAFRAARDLDKEKVMTDQLLDTLRSQENCLHITSNEALS
ncbi:hypothetical protein TRFO_02545 [Tritrichomonas foetus]|uniref:Piezo non-specific cation channel cap domain-containing protein n=1 Tax=Tritrichomonas foetus TaxID=1144522 RepID=A0A1J4L235_9EUKA|nr:hypothetical protein TRFO_02545 [Tritrichomonas foetus]|eukprot:OHT17507.1 hypothetical protein TRFO_02545 [Tritrichomonas foetus]